MACDLQSVQRGIHVPDGEWNEDRRRVFVRGMVSEDGGTGGAIQRIDGQNKRTARQGSLGIGDRDGDRGRAELIGRRKKSARAIRSALSLHDALPIYQALFE